MLATVGCGSSGGSGGTAGKGGGAAGHGGASGSAGANGGGGSGPGGAGGGATGTGGAGGGATGTGGTGTGGAGGQAGGAGGAFAATLLVDDDNSANNDPTTPNAAGSFSDTLFTSLLAGEQIAHSTYAVPADDNNPTGPTFTQLSGVSTVIWYTGDNDTGTPPTLGATQETTLENWLDSGNKTLIIFSENLMFDLGLDWTATNGDTFAATYLGLTGGEWDVDTLGGAYDLADVSFTATGVSTVPAFSGLTFAIDADANINSTADAVNPGTGTVALVTVQADPLDTGTNSTTAVASGHTKGTSKIIYVGIPLEDIHGLPNSTSTQLFHACLKYAGLVTN